MTVKVLHIIKNFNLGGAETNLLNLIKATDPMKVEIHVAYSSGGEIEARFRKENLRFFQYAKENHKIKSLASFGIIGRLAAYLKANRIDIVHTHNFNAHIWGSLAAKLAGAKILEHVHDYRYLDIDEFRRRKGTVYQFRYIRYFKNMADRVVVLTKQNRDFLVANRYYPPEKIREIRNGIPMAEADCDGEALRKKWGLDADDRIVFTPARFSPEKNIELILAIARKVAERVRRVKFVVAGDGPLKTNIEDRLRSEGLGSLVRLVGYVADIHELLGVADVFLLPSFLELHSIAILEAMSAKVPVVVSSDVGCNTQMFTDGQNGYLRDPFSPESWVEPVAGLLENKELRSRVGLSGYELCVRDYGIRRVAKQFEELYKEMKND